MNLKRSVAMAALAIGILMLVSGCGLRVSFDAQASPTSPPTRTPRPTFTPRPLDTDTPAATDTPQVTDTPQPSDTSVPPTKRPVVATAKPKPPTNTPAPQQPTAIPASPIASFPYKLVGAGEQCFHSGGVYIEIYVYTLYPDSPLAGVKVRASYAPDGPALGDVDLTTDGSGKAQYTLQTTLPAKVGKYWAWVINGSGKRISPLSPEIDINNLGEDDPNACQLARVGFTQQ